MGVKAVGIAIKLTIEETNQFTYFQTWFFTLSVIGCCILQINYLNKVSYGVNEYTQIENTHIRNRRDI